MEKDNGLPSVDCGASGHEKCRNVSRVIHRMDLAQLQEKVSGNLRRFVSEKMKENEH